MAKEGSIIILIEDIGAVTELGDRDNELWVINVVTVGGSLTSTHTNPACSARLESSHTLNISANILRSISLAMVCCGQIIPLHHHAVHL